MDFILDQSTILGGTNSTSVSNDQSISGDIGDQLITHDVNTSPIEPTTLQRNQAYLSDKGHLGRWWDHTFNPPGYAFMGPNNVMTHGKEATNEADLVSFMHDVDFGWYEHIGMNPKLQANESNERFVKTLS